MLHLSFEQDDVPRFEVRKITVEETLSRPFHASIVAASRSPDVDLSRIVGHRMSFTLSSRRGPPRPSRTWAGLCARGELLKAEPTGESAYWFRLVPRLWTLSQRAGYRIHQRLSVPQIAARVLDEHRVKHRLQLSAEYPRLPYRTQYDETDLAFVSRLLEEAGITYFLQDPEDDGGEPVMVLTDAPGLTPATVHLPFADNPNPVSDEDWVTRVRLSHEVRPGALSMRDFDFEKPRVVLEGDAPDHPEESQYSHHRYEPGTSVVLLDTPDPSTPFADRKGAAHALSAATLTRATVDLEAERTGQLTVAFRASVAHVSPGAVFTIEDHPHSQIAGRALLATSLTIEGPRDGEWSFTGRATFAKAGVRPAKRTPRPRAFGVQSAVVTGPPGEEIHTDEHGRVRVQFPWDREGNLTDESSAWVRVSHGWAGAGYGIMALPRVGQEVLIGFLSGDPDQPMIVGRVYNGASPPPHKLPDHKTVSTWRTASSPYTGGFNELRFEDRAAQEEIYMHAQRDLVTHVLHDERRHVGNERDTHIGERDLTRAGFMIRHTIDPSGPLFTQSIMKDGLFIVTTGQATVTLEGPNRSLSADGDIEIQAKGNVIVNGAKIFLNCEEREG
ncbi:MAG: type VI secretion system tip protein TssI/VgrG [Polyangiaceae bacterium]